jgi:hypothetical protein
MLLLPTIFYRTFDTFSVNTAVVARYNVWYLPYLQAYILLYSFARFRLSYAFTGTELLTHFL